MAAAKNQQTSVDTLKTYESQLSTVFGFVIVVAIGIGLLFLLRRTALKPNPSISDAGSQTNSENLMKDEEAGKYTVKTGDHLWKIAESELKDGYQWVTIANANGIKSPYVVTEGQVLTIPSPDPKIESLMAKETSTPAPAVASPVAATPVVTVAPTATPLAQSPAPTEKPAAVTPASGSHTVVSGESLWSIAVAEYKDGYKWVEIYKANKELIGTNPGIILAGQQLTLPSTK